MDQMKNVNSIRDFFPQLSEQVYGKKLIYLDNAATSLRPRQVLDKWREMSAEKNANIHRAVHYFSSIATQEYEDTRQCVASFVNAASPKEIIFTSGATASLNLVASCFSESQINAGDEIIIAQCEHHSDIVPWQLQAEKRSAVIKVLDVDDNGCISVSELAKLLTPKTKIVCIAHVSNVLGVVNPIKEIAALCHSRGCALLVDGAQGIVHQRVDVQDLDCDFYAFSGHKLYAATGTGVLYAKQSWLDAMPPFMGGGEMIDTVSFSGTTFAKAPQKFEAGTQNINSVPTLQPALKLAEEFRNFEIEKAQAEMKAYVLEALSQMQGVKLFGTPENVEDKIPLFSMTIEGAHHEDLALILDKMGVAVRSGHMCAEPIMQRFGVTGMLRASFAPYNTMEEAEYFIRSLAKAISMLR